MEESSEMRNAREGDSPRMACVMYVMARRRPRFTFCGIVAMLRESGQYGGGVMIRSSTQGLWKSIGRLHGFVKLIRKSAVRSYASQAWEAKHEKADLRGIARDLVNEVVCWCEKNWNISIHAIYREQNRSADALAMLGNVQRVEWKEFSS
nr:hypothetical protein [Ipomoea batatas]